MLRPNWKCISANWSTFTFHLMIPRSTLLKVRFYMRCCQLSNQKFFFFFKRSGVVDSRLGCGVQSKSRLFTFTRISNSRHDHNQKVRVFFFFFFFLNGYFFRNRPQRKHGAPNDDDDNAWNELMDDENDVLLCLDDIAIADDAATRLRDDEELILGPSLLAGTSKLAKMRDNRLANAGTSSYDATATSRRAALLLRRAAAGTGVGEPFGSSFRINSCQMHPSGAVVLDASDANRPFNRVSSAHVGSSLARARHRRMTSVDQQQIVAMTPGLKSARSMPRETPSRAPASPYRADDFGGGGFGDDGFGDVVEHGEDDAPNVQRSILFGGVLSREGAAGEINEASGAEGAADDDDDDAAAGVWQFLDMHSAANNEPLKPFRLGNTRQNVDALVGKARAANEAAMIAALDWPALPSDVYTNATDAELSTLLRNVTLAEFAPARAAALQRMRRDNSANDSGATDNADNADDAGEPPLAADDFGGDGFGGGGGGFDDLVDEGAVVEERQKVAAVVAFDDVPQESYEDLCRRYVESYMSRAAAFARQTEVSRRVATWTDRIEPMLEEQTQRKTFDIHVESQQILDTVENIDPQRERGALAFGELCAGAPKWDVCRRFVAALQLVNHKNLEIVPPKAGSALAFRVLSLEPRGEVADAIKADAAAPPAERAPQKAKRKALQRVNAPPTPTSSSKAKRRPPQSAQAQGIENQ
jgi:hypothetical protein